MASPHEMASQAASAETTTEGAVVSDAAGGSGAAGQVAAGEFVAREGELLPPEFHPKIDHIVTEDDEAMDNIFSEKQQRLLTEPLHSSWAAEETFVALANVGLFPGPYMSPYVPDVMLSVGVKLPDKLYLKENRSYFIWMYGKPPDVAIEIVSNREGNEDSKKFEAYADLGVPYYVIFDPEQVLKAGVLRVFQRTGKEYEPMDEPHQFAGVRLGVTLWEGRYEDVAATWLRWVTPDGTLVPTGAERAEAEHERAERLAEQLRQLGVEPES